MKHMFSSSKGFTLIELLVVIAIIGLLASTVFTSLGSARAKARDARRMSDMNEIAKALDLYYAQNGSYPVVATWSSYGNSVNGGACGVGGGTSGAGGYIPNLAPTYLAQLPVDPSGNTAGCSGYLYYSNGVEYKLLDHATGPESLFPAGHKFYDSVRPTWSWKLCSGEPACSSW